MTASRRPLSLSFGERAKLNWICLEQYLLFSVRHVRYFKIFAFHCAYSLLHPRKSRVLRYGFCALQWIDDLLDGDRASPEEPLDLVARLQAQIASENWESGSSSETHPQFRNLWRLTRGLWIELMAISDSPAKKNEAKHALIEVIGAMMEDRRRVRDGLLWSGADLRSHHCRTFRHSMDLTLIAMGSDLRADAVPKALEFLGWCSTLRDLKEDLAKGLINIPAEVIPPGKFPMRAPWRDLAQEPTVANWIHDYTEEARKLYVQCEEGLQSLGKRKGISFFRVMIQSSKKYFPKDQLPEASHSKS